jgi:hypothetical protein
MHTKFKRIYTASDCSVIFSRDIYIEVEKIDTKNQIADILTKGLSKDLYEALRKMLVGW